MSFRENFGLYGRSTTFFETSSCSNEVSGEDAGYCVCNTRGVKVFFDKEPGRDVFNCIDLCNSKGFYEGDAEMEQKIPKLHWQIYPVINQFEKLPGLFATNN